MFQAREFVELTLVQENLRLCATIRHTDGQRMLIEVEAQDAALIAAGATIQLVQPVAEGLYVIETTVVNRRDSMVVANCRTPQLLQRRRSQRVACDYPAFYKRDVTLAELPALRPDDAEPGQAIDVSLGGLKMLTGKLLCANFNIGVSIHLGTGQGDTEIVYAEASIVRCTLSETPRQTERGNLTFVAAVKFSRVARIDQVRLQRFLMVNQ